MIRKIDNKPSVILLQNAFSILEKYIDHIHLLENGEPVKVIDTLKNQILSKFKLLSKLKSKEIIFFLLMLKKLKIATK